MTDPLSQRVQAAVRDALATTSQNTSAGLDVSADLITSAVLAEVHRQHAAAEPPADRYRAAWQSAQRGRREARAELARLLHETQERIAELERLRARLDDVHRTPQDNITPAEVRLEQYGRRTKTWSTATYDSGTEKALHEIACQLRDTLEDTRDQRNAARLKVAGLEDRVAELEKQLAESTRADHYTEAARTATETAARLRAEGHTTRARGAEDVADLLHAAARQETAAPDAAPWPPVTVYTVEIWDTDTWVGASRKCGTPDEARERRDAARRRLPNGRFRIVRWDETSTVMETDPEPTQP